MKKYYLETYGCQMNEYDSHLVERLLNSRGLVRADKEEDADLVILNTCSVRHKAEERALGRIRSITSNGHPRQVAVIGCMAQRMGDRLLDANPNVRFVLGTTRFTQLAELVAEELDSPVVDTSGIDDQIEFPALEGRSSLSEYVTIMRGCNNFCTYCIVPHVRGRERCRAPENIIAEVNQLEQSGVREIWLLGQNVNSYRHEQLDFVALLKMILQNTEVPRIRFLTSHPRDFSEELIEIMASSDRICSGIHLPLQSGSNPVLKRMNRRYTIEDYAGKVELLKKMIPDVVLTTDIIVGFPGETRFDFERTLEAVRKLEYDSAFMFRYSVRETTKAAGFKDDVPETEKLSRLEELIETQKSISEKRMASRVGSVQEVLIEKSARHDEADGLGKNEGGLNCVVRQTAGSIGNLVKAKIVDSTYTTLIGERIRG